MLNRQPIDPQLYRDAMSRFGGHVQLVTTVLGETRRGVTITAACSVSDDPACVLVCLNNSNPKNDIFFQSGIFALNTLGAHHQALADAFSGRTPMSNDERFATGKFDKLVTGAPVLWDSLASFDCRVMEIKEMSTHHIIFGEVVAVRFNETKPALLYMNRDYHTL
ncbi:flavin reductase [Rhizobium mongolense]|uniref:FMN reductase (NADH) 1 n=1 Tax=Rhizobium gallicum bv. gallicum R602sp TaxID=1041138 RepID=A0A0B4X4F0_9HYPH|nr:MULTISPECIES: flavin reductase [Rhizobium]AJD41402.1 FMN reductase (NADH) 1 [Rhizobium gallicum bv. gallicum R602sp]NNH33668.1 flavin reductase [Rhizobium sp. SEMIA 4085]QPB21508.1 flavin reductase [Rhizobium sp. 007]ULJ73220.1 flavin reductase [Rhizobium gallicum]WFU89211.1 flavin reductase [Rhizobium sp. CC1099]